MGTVVKFRRHALAFASSKRANRSKVTPLMPSSSAADTTFAQRYDGMELRKRMTLACAGCTPMAAPNLVGPPKASMTEANESMTDLSLHQVATSVNTARSHFVATIRSMARDTIEKRQGARLRQARLDARFKSKREAAIENHWPESTYSAHERGARTMGRNDAELYAKAFQARGAKVTAREILFPEDPPDDIEMVAYERGWRAAMLHMVRTAAEPPATPSPPRATSRKSKNTG